ncbi:MAG: hypothetical protein JXB14_01140 [Candidatus Altiarchaeota archaeon]|nr:hypothetical protein [Candidatus Altiarchaeota archaeon]
MKRMFVALLVLPLAAGLTEYGCRQQADECRWVFCRGSYEECLSVCRPDDEDCNYLCGVDFSDCKKDCEGAYHSCLKYVDDTEVVSNETTEDNDSTSPLGSYIHNADYDLSGVFLAVLVVLAILVFMVCSSRKDATPALRGEN